jgi:hypothetical protein
MTVCQASAWRCVPETMLEGWHAWGGASVPAEGLLVRLEVIDDGAGAVALPSPDEARPRSLWLLLPGSGAPRALDVEAYLAGEDLGTP